MHAHPYILHIHTYCCIFIHIHTDYCVIFVATLFCYFHKTLQKNIKNHQKYIQNHSKIMKKGGLEPPGPPPWALDPPRTRFLSIFHRF